MVYHHKQPKQKQEISFSFQIHNLPLVCHHYEPK
jgi:hypothetical protein